MTKVLIDGSAGTTGLRIHERLASREDIQLVTLPEALRKDKEARREALNSVDVAFLCLPDDAAREAAAMVENPHTVLIDTSTAHRVSEGWCYGFSELHGQREAIRQSRRIANPGCHASGFIALVRPLVECGVLDADAVLSCFSLTGYSGGGKKMIAAYEAPHDPLLDAPRMYGLGQAHKHLPEMAKLCGLAKPPVFCPTVAPYYAGMAVTVPLHRSQLRCGAGELRQLLQAYYSQGLVQVTDGPADGYLSAAAYAGRDDMAVMVLGEGERILLAALFDNLGKGASGAAIQNMNLALGLPEALSLRVGG